MNQNNHDTERKEEDSRWRERPLVQQWIETMRHKLQEKARQQRNKAIASLFVSQDNPMEHVLQSRRPPQDIPLYLPYSIFDMEVLRFLRFSRATTGNIKTLPPDYKKPFRTTRGRIKDPRYCDGPFKAYHKAIKIFNGSEKLPSSVVRQIEMLYLYITIPYYQQHLYQHTGNKTKNGKKKINNGKIKNKELRERYIPHNLQDADILIAQPFFHYPYETYSLNNYPYYSVFHHHHMMSGLRSFPVSVIALSPLMEENESTTAHQKATDNEINPTDNDNRGKNKRACFRCVIRPVDISDMFSLKYNVSSSLVTTLRREKILLGACGYALSRYISDVQYYRWEAPVSIGKKPHLTATKAMARVRREDLSFVYQVMRSVAPAERNPYLLFNPFVQYVRVKAQEPYLLSSGTSPLDEYIRTKKDLVIYNRQSQQLGFHHSMVLHAMYLHINRSRRRLFDAVPKKTMLPIRPLYIYTIEQLYPFYLAYPDIYFRYRQLYAYHLYRLISTRDTELIQRTIERLPQLFRSQITFYQYAYRRPFTRRLRHRFSVLLLFLRNKIQLLFPDNKALPSYVDTVEKVLEGDTTISENVVSLNTNTDDDEHNGKYVSDIENIIPW